MEILWKSARIRGIGIALLLFCQSWPIQSGQVLYSMLDSVNGNDALHFLQFEVTLASQIRPGAAVTATLPNGQIVSGVVRETLVGVAKTRDIGPRETSRIVVSLNQAAGGLELIVVHNSIAGMILHMADSRDIYRADIDGNGRGVLRRVRREDFLCVELPEKSESARHIMPDTTAPVPSLTDLQDLQSKPGASGTLYIDYWGGRVTGTAWNNNFKSGNPIDYAPYDSDGDTASFSAAERYAMWLAWHETAQEYAAYDIDVTTKTLVFNTSPTAKRLRVIATKPNGFFLGAGGIAYAGVVNDSSDYYKTGWAWTATPYSLVSMIGRVAECQIKRSLSKLHDED